jgi:hypothetical protein
MLRNNTTDYHNKVPMAFEIFPVEELKQVSDGVYVSHLVPRHMPKDFIARKCKIISIYRNPKDICVSMYNFAKKIKPGELMHDMEFDGFFDMYITGQRKIYIVGCFYFIFCFNIFTKESIVFI